MFLTSEFFSIYIVTIFICAQVEPYAKLRVEIRSKCNKVRLPMFPTTYQSVLHVSASLSPQVLKIRQIKVEEIHFTYFGVFELRAHYNTFQTWHDLAYCVYSLIIRH